VGARSPGADQVGGGLTDALNRLLGGAPGPDLPLPEAPAPGGAAPDPGADLLDFLLGP
jgi:hypothetical protein